MVLLDKSCESALNLVMHDTVDTLTTADSIRQSASTEQLELYWQSSDEKDDKDGAKEGLQKSLATLVRKAVKDTLRQKCHLDLTIRGGLTILMKNGEFLTLTFDDEKSESHASPQCCPSDTKRKAYRPRKILDSGTGNTNVSSQAEEAEHSRKRMPSRMEEEEGVLEISGGGSMDNSRLNTPEKPPKEPLQQQQKTLHAEQKAAVLPMPNFGLVFVEALARMASSGIAPTTASPSSPLQIQQQLKPMTTLTLHHSPPPAKRMRVSGRGSGGAGRSSTGAVLGSRAGRRFACNLCEEATFASLGELERHTRATHGSYECHECHARFTQRSNLQRHALRHVGFKPFGCRLCGRAYYRKDHLMRHIAALHPDLPTPASHQHMEVRLSSAEALDFLLSHRRHQQPQQQHQKQKEEKDETEEQRRQEKLQHDLSTDDHIVSSSLSAAEAVASSSSSGVSSEDGVTSDSNSSHSLTPHKSPQPWANV